MISLCIAGFLFCQYQGGLFENPKNRDQLAHNISVIFPGTLRQTETANQLFDAYLGNRDWPKTAEKSQQIQRMPGKPIKTEEFKAFYFKNRGPIPDSDKTKLEGMRARFSPAFDDEDKQKTLVEKMEKGVINKSVAYLPGGNGPVKLLKGQWIFKDEETKTKVVGFEKEMLEEIQKAWERQNPKPKEPQFYRPPNNAKYKPKTKEEARQAFDEASYWYAIGFNHQGVRDSIKSDLQENKIAKEKEWRDFPK